jgi:transposase-like protein
VGAALPARIRKALEALRSARRRIVEDGRELYKKVHGQRVYQYRAIDKAGQTVDFYLSRNRDVKAAKSFLRSAMKNTGVPMKITWDAYAASHRAVREMQEDGELPCRVKVRSSLYLNNG